jgi:hypothetical protein
VFNWPAHKIRQSPVLDKLLALNLERVGKTPELALSGIADE